MGNECDKSEPSMLEPEIKEVRCAKIYGGGMGIGSAMFLLVILGVGKVR